MERNTKTLTSYDLSHLSDIFDSDFHLEDENVQLSCEELLELLNLGVNPTLKVMQDDMVRIWTDFYRNINIATNSSSSFEAKEYAQEFAQSSYSKLNSIFDVVSSMLPEGNNHNLTYSSGNALPDVLLPADEQGLPILTIMGENRALEFSTQKSKIDGYVKIDADFYYAFYALKIRELLKKDDIESNLFMQQEPLSKEDLVIFANHYLLMNQIARLQADERYITNYETEKQTVQKAIGSKVG